MNGVLNKLYGLVALVIIALLIWRGYPHHVVEVQTSAQPSESEFLEWCNQVAQGAEAMAEARDQGKGMEWALKPLTAGACRTVADGKGGSQEQCEKPMSPAIATKLRGIAILVWNTPSMPAKQEAELAFSHCIGEGKSAYPR
jgi:hypothetical protein